MPTLHLRLKPLYFVILTINGGLSAISGQSGPVKLAERPGATASGNASRLNAGRSSFGGEGIIAPPAPGIATQFAVSAPVTASAGVSFTLWVGALDGNNQPVAAFSHPVHFSSSDPAATLPPDTVLGGWEAFSVSLVAKGTQTITVTDPEDPTISGTSENITVGSTSGALFIPVSACRVVDTRGAAGPFGGPFVPAGGIRNFAIRSSPNCVIPANVEAYSLNLTVAPHGTLGYATLWPTGQAQPSVSTLNSIDGREKANAAIVGAGAGGAVSLFATNDTDVILDINGYFVNGYFVTPSDSTAEAFYPITPCRLVDTRAGAPWTVSAGALIGGTSRTLPLLSSNCGVPATAAAYSLNFTAIPSNGTLGFLTAYPSGAAQPETSTLNAPTGTVVANAEIVQAGAQGSIDVYASDTTDLVVDINGYFAPPGTGGLSFYPVNPCRPFDTRRVPQGQLSGDETYGLGAWCEGTSAPQAFVLNITVIPVRALGYLTLWPYGAAPLVSTLNALDGSITSNMAILPADFTTFPNDPGFFVYFTDSTDLVVDMTGYFAP